MDIYAFILNLILMANANAAAGMQYDYTKGLNQSSFSYPTQAATPERTRVRNQRGL